MSRGFLKPVAGIPRLRMVTAGNDADNFTLPPQDVIFDSEALGGFPVYTQGIVTVSTARTFATGFLVTWSDMGYIPFGMCEVGKDNVFYSLIASTEPSIQSEYYFTSTGLRASMSGFIFPMQVRYTVFSVKVL